jgi:hypothetical protein
MQSIDNWRRAEQAGPLDSHHDAVVLSLLRSGVQRRCHLTISGADLHSPRFREGSCTLAFSRRYTSRTGSKLEHPVIICIHSAISKFEECVLSES